MDVLAVTPYYAPEGGGLERYAHEILHRLADEHTVEAIAFTREDRPDEAKQGVRVHRRKPATVLGNAPIDPRLPGAIGERIEEREPDVVVAHTPVPFPAEAAAFASWRREVPFVVTYHAGRLSGSSPALDLAAGLHRRTVQRLMLAYADELIAVSPSVERDALAAHADKVTSIPPGVDRDRFAPGPDTEEPEIAFVGPLSSTYAWKGLDTLWAAFADVKDRVPEARLTLVGEGDRREELRDRARASWDGDVRLPGRVSDEELVRVLQRARVLALPSTSPAESFGMVLAEANACRTPVVGSRIGGIPTFVDHEENGLLAEPGDARDLADKLVRVLQNDELAHRLGEEGRRRVQADHDWDELAARTEHVLQRATGA